MDVNKMAARYKLKMPGATAGGGVPALSSTDLGAAARQSRSRKGSRTPSCIALHCTAFVFD